MLDKLNANVEILIDSKNRVWVNVDGVCAVRVGKADSITIEDKRKTLVLGDKVRTIPLREEDREPITMNFWEVIQHEGRTGNQTKYHRVDKPGPDDGEWNWYIQFVEDIGQLVMFTKSPTHSIPTILYHHDLLDGEWGIYEEGEQKETETPNA